MEVLWYFLAFAVPAGLTALSITGIVAANNHFDKTKRVPFNPNKDKNRNKTIPEILADCGIQEEGKWEEDGDYGIFFKTEDDAWEALVKLKRYDEFHELPKYERRGEDWVQLAFGSHYYRFDFLIDRRAGVQKLVCSKYSSKAKNSLTAKDLDKIRVEKSEFKD